MRERSVITAEELEFNAPGVTRGFCATLRLTPIQVRGEFSDELNGDGGGNTTRPPRSPARNPEMTWFEDFRRHPPGAGGIFCWSRDIGGAAGLAFLCYQEKHFELKYC
jgi:hypothetical protein